MLKFSASYNGVNPNFVILNIEDKKINKSPIFYLMHNILQRGCPTIPSKFLRIKFDYKQQEKSNYKYCCDFSNVKWEYVIKGGDTTNPAYKFYTQILPKIIGDQKAKTFICECPFKDIINSLSKKVLEYNQVDFYSPLYNAVIEIDGFQHDTNEEQILKDEERDKTLIENHVSIIRIKTSELNNFDLIKEKLSVLQENNVYAKKMLTKNTFTNQEANFMVAIRMQMLFLYLYRNETIKYNQDKFDLNIYTTDNIEQSVFETAINDFYLWVQDFCKLQNLKYYVPKINIKIVKSEYELSKCEGINVYLSLKQVYSQTTYKNIFYIQNDYFLFEENLVEKRFKNEKNTFLYQKNHFIVKKCDINYKLSIKEHEKTLLKFLGNVSICYKEFRENQLNIIVECLNSKSVIGLLPTGAGKSLCYQIVALLVPGITIVVAPLQLLMIDQQQNLVTKLGIKNSTYINSSHTENQNIFMERKSLITIISPERFFNETFSKCLKYLSLQIKFVVIDEAHCISEWGHDFRTSYLCLSHNLHNYFNKETYLIGLTGTASHRVLKDIESEFKNFKQKPTNIVFAQNMKRTNLTVIIKQTDNKFKNTFDLIYPTLSGVSNDKVLVFTKKKTAQKNNIYDSACISLVEQINILYKDKINSNLLDLYYGDDINPKIKAINKEKVLKDFKEGKTKVIFATKAFGMGVDIPDIRKTIHYGLPSSFESLYQEIGRAGRDNKESMCYVFFKEENPVMLNEFFKFPPMSFDEIRQRCEILEELNTNFFFISISNLDLEKDEKITKDILNFIKEKIKKGENFFKVRDIDLKEIKSRYTNKQTIIEKTLYRLFLLGEINMWNLVYTKDLTNPAFTNLTLTKLTEQEKYEKLKYYIEKYQTQIDDLPQNTFDYRLKYILNWTRENFLRERIQSLKTVYEQCTDYINSDRFMNYVSSYFSNDPVFVRLLNKNIEVKDIDSILKMNPNLTKARIARLLESYDKMVALNFVSGITRLKLGDYENTDGKERLVRALIEIKNFDEKQRNNLFYVGFKNLNKKQQNTFVEEWLTIIKEDAKFIYKQTQNLVCEKYLITNFINEILKTGEKINDRLRRNG